MSVPLEFAVVRNLKAVRKSTMASGFSETRHSSKLVKSGMTQRHISKTLMLFVAVLELTRAAWSVYVER